MRNTEQDKAVVSQERLETYLSSLFGQVVDVVHVEELGKEEKEGPLQKGEERELKGFGYGAPHLIVANVSGHLKRIVLETMRTDGGFGHDYFSDRAGILLWQHSAFNKLPKHVKSVDVGAFTKDRALKSLGDCDEFFIVTEYVDGTLYHVDLDRLRRHEQLLPLDLNRCRALSDYLVDIHKVKSDRTELYVRRIRDLVGHGECIMGLLDSYPTPLTYISENEMMNIEKSCVEWRWKLKQHTHRLAQVHGDFHPWNLLFRKNSEFTILDRSRGDWGEPADDLSALTINYLFYSLQAHGRLTKSFETLFNSFWENYLDKTGDDEVLSIIQPFFAWRGLVVASPIWYPNLPEDVRVKLFSFVKNVLDSDKLDLNINSYLES